MFLSMEWFIGYLGLNRRELKSHTTSHRGLILGKVPRLVNQKADSLIDLVNRHLQLPEIVFKRRVGRI
jgi:hypothetical protein